MYKKECSHRTTWTASSPTTAILNQDLKSASQNEVFPHPHCPLQPSISMAPDALDNPRSPSNWHSTLPTTGQVVSASSNKREDVYTNASHTAPQPPSQTNGSRSPAAAPATASQPPSLLPQNSSCKSTMPRTPGRSTMPMIRGKSLCAAPTARSCTWWM